MLRDSILLGVLSAMIFGACDNDPIDVPCPDVEIGELVVTEIHGPQSSGDQYGEWIEVFNPTARTLDLTGLSVVIAKLDGSSDASLLIRTKLSLAPGGYTVLGRQQSPLPPHVNYGYEDDVERGLFDSGAVRVSSCGKEIDLAVYRNLPSKGSLLLNGVVPPDADANSEDVNWCIDEREDLDTPVFGVRGTPGVANPFCDGSACSDDGDCASGTCDVLATPNVCGAPS